MTRLRLERGALELWLQDATVLDTALRCGFTSHETFTRAFRRHFGVLPKAVKREGISVLPSVASSFRASHPAEPGGGFELSSTRVTALKPMHLLFLRHVGPYETVDDSLWRTLQDRVAKRGLPSGWPLLGIGHDAPGLTPEDKLRFDAAVRVPGPVAGDGLVGYQVLEGGTYAVTTHVGHFDTLGEAYAVLGRRLAALETHQPTGPPAVEIYQENTVDAELSFNHTDIYLPVARRPPRPTPDPGGKKRQDAAGTLL